MIIVRLEDLFGPAADFGPFTSTANADKFLKFIKPFSLDPKMTFHVLEEKDPPINPEDVELED
jgi:hypothetical protein